MSRSEEKELRNAIVPRKSQPACRLPMLAVVLDPPDERSKQSGNAMCNDGGQPAALQMGGHLTG